ncbi:MAG: threonine synthase, partial [Gemmatimonadaceae bacterium]
MSTSINPQSTSALAPLPLACAACEHEVGATPQAICPECLGPLEPVYDPTRSLPSREEIATRPRSLWRYHEWLPFSGAPVHAQDVGWTPLVESPALARRLGVAKLWLKLDSLSFPSLSFKDRVVSTAINAAEAFGLDVIGCASTGNLANAVAAAAARAGRPAWIFVPYDLELGKLVATTVFNPHLVRVKGNYDDVNRLCAQVADRFGWGIVNVNLRAYYGEGSKTMAFEIAEQLGWRLPTAVVTPMAGGSLVTKLRKGFGEVRDARLAFGRLPRQYGAQADGCSPIVKLAARGDDVLIPEVPNTIARSLAI